MKRLSVILLTLAMLFAPFFVTPAAAQGNYRPTIDITGIARVGPYTLGRLKIWLNQWFWVIEDGTPTEYRCAIHDARAWIVGGDGNLGFSIPTDGEPVYINLGGSRTGYQMRMTMQIVHQPTGQTLFQTADGPQGSVGGRWQVGGSGGATSISLAGSGGSDTAAIDDYFAQLPTPARLGAQIYHQPIAGGKIIQLFGPPGTAICLRSFNPDTLTLRGEKVFRLDQTGRLHVANPPTTVHVQILAAPSQLVWQGLLSP